MLEHSKRQKEESYRYSEKELDTTFLLIFIATVYNLAERAFIGCPLVFLFMLEHLLVISNRL